MASLAGLSSITSASLSISNLLLVSPQSTIGYQPQPNAILNGNTASSLKPILFNYEGEQAVQIESDITDHYIEDNTAISDQIALRPETITTHGFIGELNDVAPEILQPLKKIADKLVSIGSYTPELSTSAILAYNEAAFLYSTATSAKDALLSTWSAINGTGGESVINGAGITVSENQTKQQIYFQQFYQYWRARALFTVQTPWAVFQNMAIKSMRAIQDESTRTITDFEITFKMMRFAQTVTAINGKLNASNNLQGRLFSQGSPTVNQGPSSLTSSPLVFATTL